LLERLVSLAILSRVGGTEWASPTFIIPKKDACVCWISDFCELSKVIVCRKIYPLPLIQDILKKQTSYKFFTKIDISMQYHTFELTNTVKELVSAPLSLPLENIAMNEY
jgi:tRNA uridine 5-carbamoylmethylation protein Kti12